MSNELRRLLHTAAETGPLPDVDAILARARRRHRRRVAFGVGTGLLAVVIAIPTLWPGTNDTGTPYGAVEAELGCQPKPAARDISRYAPTYLPPDSRIGPAGWADAPGEGNIFQRTFDSVIVPSPASSRLGKKWTRVTLRVHRTSRARLGVESVRGIDSFELDCGRGAAFLTASAMYLTWQLDADTSAYLSVVPETYPAPDVLDQLIEIARSVAIH